MYFALSFLILLLISKQVPHVALTPFIHVFLSRQCALAVELQLPLVVHSREAESDTIQILTKIMPKSHFIHIHCFTSSEAMAKELLDYFPNLYIGFTGVITFKKADEVQNVVKIGKKKEHFSSFLKQFVIYESINSCIQYSLTYSF